MSDINEEVHPSLLEAWKLFDKKARELDVKYSIEADEPLRQVYMMPSKTGEDKSIWKGIADYMYQVKPVEEGKVLIKVDPGYRKDNVFFELTIVAINDDDQEKIEYSGPLSELQSRLNGVLYTPPHITLNQLPVNSQRQEEPETDVGEELTEEETEILDLVHELRQDFSI